MAAREDPGGGVLPGASGDGDAKDQNGAAGIHAVGRALDVLDLLASSEMGVGEVARSLKVNKSTASRLLNTMLRRGFVGRDPTVGSFRLGPRIAHLYQSYVDNLRVGRHAAVLLDRLAAETSETVLLTLFQDGAATYIDKVDSRFPLRTSSRIGDRAPLHCGATGKAILAFLPEDEARELLGSGPLRRYTPSTIVSRRKLFAELAEIRRQGYAVSDEEINPGVVGVGAPLLGWRGRPMGAISVTAPKLRTDDVRLRKLIDLVRDTARTWQHAVP